MSWLPTVVDTTQKKREQSNALLSVISFELSRCSFMNNNNYNNKKKKKEKEKEKEKKRTRKKKNKKRKKKIQEKKPKQIIK